MKNMLPNEAKLVVNNIRSIIESDGLNVPVKYLNEGMRSLVHNLPIDSSIQKCIDAVNSGRAKEPDSIEKPSNDNSPAIYNPKNLKLHDAALSFFRLLKLELVPVPAAFDTDHLKSVHKIIFSDILPNAGNYRIKNAKLKGDEFISCNMIPQRVHSLLNLINKEEFKELTKNDIAMRISYFMHELFVIHPFSEGNGRVSRVFFRQLADHIGYRLNYSKINGITLRAAEILAFRTENLQPLYVLINKCLSPI